MSYRFQCHRNEREANKMRKLLAYILSLVLITGFCSVGQSEEKGQEILFRGIPWGSSIEV